MCSFDNLKTLPFIVAIYKHPFVALFKAVIQLIGPLYFEYGTPLLEACYQNTSIWPNPVPGSTHELPLLGTILNFHIPFNSSPHIIDPKRKQIISAAPKEQVVSNLESINLYKCFHGLEDKLWTLWELVLLGEPILILSPSPSQASDAVFGLVSLISPLTYGGDFRPYFTIHDVDFKGYTSMSKSMLPSIILGVTNPFFCKALEHWPHILKVGEPTNRRTSSGSSGLRKGNALISDFKEELTTKYKRLNTIDKDVLDKLNRSNTEESITANNEILRKHFLQQTEDFLIPLERYFTSLMPLMRDVSLFRKPPNLKKFDEEEFLNIISTSAKKGILISWKNHDTELYKAFLSSPNFRVWFNSKRKEVDRRLQETYQQMILQADINNLTKDRNEIEIVDLYMRVSEQFEIIQSKTPNKKEVIERLQEHLVSILKRMPPDLQTSIARQEKSKQIFTIEDDENLDSEIENLLIEN